MGPVKRRVSNAATFPNTHSDTKEFRPQKSDRAGPGRRTWLTKGSSSIFPLGAVVAFSLLVIGLIVFLFKQQSTSPGKPFQPGGVPPRIRSVRTSSARRAPSNLRVGLSARNMTKSSSWDVRTPTRVNQEPMRPSSYLRAIKSLMVY